MHVVIRRARFFLATSLCALGTAAQGGETVAYSYDSLGRLVATSSSGTVNNGLATSLSYDSAGNRLCYRVAGTAGPCPPPPPPPDPGPPPAPPSASAISVANSSASEGSPLVFTVSRTGTAAASVSWTLLDGSAAMGTDYVSNGGQVSFAAGESSKTIAVQTLSDSLAEGSETMSVHLYAPTDATLGNSVAVGTILDVPPPPAPNNPPTPVSDSGSQLRCTTQTYAVTANDTDPNGDYPLVLTLSSNAAFEIVSGSEIQFTGGNTGTYATTYTVRDSRGATATSTLTVTVYGACSNGEDPPP
jgi:hypothetical protein